MLIDIHVHSSHTPGVPFGLDELVARIKQSGLDGFCLTDLHTLNGANEAKSIAQKEGILALAGFEAQTNRGHYLVFVPNPEDMPEITTWLNIDSENILDFGFLVKSVEEKKGVLVAAHPFDRSLPESPGDALVQLEGVSAIEVLNAGRPSLANELAEEIAAGTGLPGVGSSDARTSLDLIGRFATLVRGPISNETDLIDRIRSYDVWPAAIGKPAFNSSAKDFRKKESDRRPSRSNSSRNTSRSQRGSSHKPNRRDPTQGRKKGPPPRPDN